MESLLRLPVTAAASVRLLIPMVLLATIVNGCIGDASAYVPPSPPPQAEARNLVNRVVQLTLSHDFDQLCTLGTPECRQVLHATGTDTAPSTAPAIVGATTVPNQETSPGTWTPGGVLFSLCGLDGKGQPYHSQMLVFENREGTGLTAMEPVFWGSLTIGSTVAGPAPSLSSIWEGCPS
jgi:hypothetical protein